MKLIELAVKFFIQISEFLVIEYNYPWGWKELEGIANRTDYDLKQHSKVSKSDLSYFDEEGKEKIIPYVIEPSFGLERTILTLLLDAYDEKNDKDGMKVLLKLSPEISPVQVAVFPLMKKDGLDKKAKEIFEALKKEFVCEYDESGSIGKRYARSDEVGIPFAVTVDYVSLKKKDVTIRNRDDTSQIRVSISSLKEEIQNLISGKKKATPRKRK